jgi:hypothetical protein
MALDGLAVFYATAGGVLLWSGFKGQTVGQTVKAITSSNAGTLAASGPQVITGGQETAGTAGGEASGKPGDTSAHSPGAAANQATARLLAVSLGHPDWIAGQEWADWVSLWNQESGWRSDAQNPASTAYGIAQFLDTTWAPYGPKTSNPQLQIAYGIRYIAGRYGSPSKAWAHEQSFNWY